MLWMVEFLANQDYQRRVWIEDKDPEVNNFNETIAEYTYSEGIILNNPSLYPLTEVQKCVLGSLTAIIKDFYKNGLDSGYIYEPEYFIDSTEWRKVFEQATRVLRVFGYLAGDRYIHCREYSSEVKKQLLKSFLDAIACLATADTNAKIWKREERYEDNFEFIYCLFHAEIDAYLENPQEFEIDFQQIEKLKKLNEILNFFVRNSGFTVDPETFVHTTECKMIAAAAREVIEVFKRELRCGELFIT